MKYVFGPVPSRRLGRSLGIDPIPSKTCNWNCVYCQLGRTFPATTERAEYVPAEEVVAEVRAFLAERGEEALDWVTFVGSGEPTLHARLGWMIREVKALTSKPVAVMTNGSLLWDPAVREELAVADAVMPTISAADERTYLRLHRPAHGLDFDRFVEGLVTFREVYKGKLWAEVMLVDGLNDGEDHLLRLAGLLRRVRPDAIQVVLPTRPPSVPTVRPAGSEAVRRALWILGDVAPVTVPEGPSGVEAADGALADVILGLVQRHPMTDRELSDSLPQAAPEALAGALRELASDGRCRLIALEERHGVPPEARGIPTAVVGERILAGRSESSAKRRRERSSTASSPITAPSCGASPCRRTPTRTRSRRASTTGCSP